MSSLKKKLPCWVQGGQLVQMLDRQRSLQAAEDAAKKEALAARNLVDATKEAEETSIAAVAAAALSAPEAAQVSLSGSTATAALLLSCLLLCAYVSDCRRPSETGGSHFRTSFSISGKVPGRG